eukprot:Clim_evm12s218 gene=Clim_evmTU12s218
MTSAGRTRDLSETDQDNWEEEVDPRVEGALERLNLASTEVNEMENRLAEAKRKQKNLVNDAQTGLQDSRHKLGSCVQNAWKYYELLREIKRLNEEMLRASYVFESASEEVKNAKALSGQVEEQVLNQKEKFDDTWQEAMNRANEKLADAKTEQKRASSLHYRYIQEISKAVAKRDRMYQKKKRTIDKAKPYYDLRDAFEISLRSIFQIVQDLEDEVHGKRSNVKASLEHLNTISEEVHAKRIAMSTEEFRDKVRISEKLHESDNRSMSVSEVLRLADGFDGTAGLSDDDLSSSGLDPSDMALRAASPASPWSTGTPIPDEIAEGRDVRIESFGHKTEEQPSMTSSVERGDEDKASERTSDTTAPGEEIVKEEVTEVTSSESLPTGATRKELDKEMVADKPAENHEATESVSAAPPHIIEPTPDDPSSSTVDEQ